MKIGISGHFGGKHSCLNGQTVKTKSVTNALGGIFGDENLITVDTYAIKKRFLIVLFQTIKMFFTCDVCIMFPCRNGLKVFTPIFAVLNKICKKNIYYVVIGGWLPSFLEGRELLAKQLKKFNCIFVETNAMKRKLEEKGFKNITILPNFKKIDVIKPEELVYCHSEPYKLCTFSRVMKEKGIEDALKAVELANEQIGKVAYSLDIYGQIDNEYKERFEDLSESFPDHIRYAGEVAYDKSTSVLKEYFLLLFPTFYTGEGFAGTLIDAFSSGLPIIASDWNYNSEFVDNEVGFLFETGNVQMLSSILIDIYQNKVDLKNMKLNCISKAKTYTFDNAAKILKDHIV